MVTGNNMLCQQVPMESSTKAQIEQHEEELLMKNNGMEWKFFDVLWFRYSSNGNKNGSLQDKLQLGVLEV